MKNKRYVYWSGTIHCFCASQRTYLITGGKCVARLARSQGLRSTVDLVQMKKHCFFFIFYWSFRYYTSSIPQKNLTLNTSRSTTLLFLLRGISFDLLKIMHDDYQDAFVSLLVVMKWRINSKAVSSVRSSRVTECVR